MVVGRSFSVVFEIVFTSRQKMVYFARKVFVAVSVDQVAVTAVVAQESGYDQRVKLYPMQSRITPRTVVIRRLEVGGEGLDEIAQVRDLNEEIYDVGESVYIFLAHLLIDDINGYWTSPFCGGPLSVPAEKQIFRLRVEMDLVRREVGYRA